MNTVTKSRLFKLGLLGLLAACVSSGVLQAQVLKGEFTLPVEVHWGPATLPAGNYSFTLASNTPPFIMFVSRTGREGKTVMVMASGVADNTPSNRSELVIVRHGATGTVRALALADLGLVVHYPGPKGESQPTIAKGPELIQRIPVAANGR